MKKVISCMICALLLVGCMAGCGSTGGKSGSGNGIKIMMSLSQGDDFRNTIVEQAKKTAQEKGATLDVYDEDGSLESQVEHIKQAAKEKYDVILCGPVNADTALELESLADGIPVIFYNSCPDASYLETGKYMYVGSDENVAGQYQAEYILDKFSSSDEINVAIFKGPRNHSATKGLVCAMTAGVSPTPIPNPRRSPAGIPMPDKRTACSRMIRLSCRPVMPIVFNSP